MNTNQPKKHLNYHLEFNNSNNTMQLYFFSTMGEELLKYSRELNKLECAELYERKKEIILNISKSFSFNPDLLNHLESFDIILSNECVNKDYQENQVFDISTISNYIQSSEYAEDFTAFPVLVLKTNSIPFKFKDKIFEMLSRANSLYEMLPENFKKYSIPCPFDVVNVAYGSTGAIVDEPYCSGCIKLREREVAKMIAKNPQLLLSETEIQNNNQNNIVAINNVHEQQLDQTRG